MIDFGRDISFVRDGNLFRLRAAAVIIRDECVLMAKNKNVSYFYSRGGAVQFGETVEQALLREVKEETGCKPEIIRLLTVHQNFFKGNEWTKDDWHELSFYYLTDIKGEVRTNAGSVSMLGAEEYLEWIPIKKYGMVNAFPLFFKDLNSILKSPTPLFLTDRE